MDTIALILDSCESCNDYWTLTKPCAIRSNGLTPIFVTGGAGYIGSHMVYELDDTGGERVAVVDNRSTGALAV
jgi:hypothetical protein